MRSRRQGAGISLWLRAYDLSIGALTFAAMPIVTDQKKADPDFWHYTEKREKAQSCLMLKGHFQTRTCIKWYATVHKRDKP